MKGLKQDLVEAGTYYKKQFILSGLMLVKIYARNMYHTQDTLRKRVAADKNKK